MKTNYLLVPFSFVFHPIFVSIYGSVLYFIFSGNTTPTVNLYITFLQIVILTVVLPLCFYLLFRILNVVSSFTEATIEERKIPIFIQLFLMYVLIKYAAIHQNYPELYLFFVGGFVSSFVVLLAVMFRFKASLHMIGVTSLCMFTILFTSYLQINAIYTIVCLLLCVGFVASSRLYMKAHTPIELIIGSLIGIIPQYLVWIYKI